MTGPSPTRRRRVRSLTDLQSYSEIARRSGLRLCTCGSETTPRQHEAGWTAWRLGVIHWSPRNLTRRGIYRFLKLVATEIDRDCSSPRVPLQLYRRNVDATILARHLGIRIPREFGAQDRARTRATLHQIHDLPPDTRRRIREWSRP